MNNNLTIDRASAMNFVVVKLEGSFAFEDKQKVKANLDQAIEYAKLSKRDVGIDFTGVEYLNASVLGLFIDYHKDLLKLDVSIYLFNLKKAVKKLFKLTGINKLYPVRNFDLKKGRISTSAG